ncbi:helix-turn-helix domain-containing protein [Streptomyces sp. NPDC001980]|uniref:helix-turn-helix domain-containing protein n=1 Tax=Streptomyces sp. NPDC001980 TaxID=3157126 RepID=UPI003324D023
MPRRKALPESTDPRVRRLVVELRRLKDHSGLSMAALASTTGFSRSSWERYLNGRVTPPRQAVETMADVCGGDRIGLAALWEVAISDTAPGLTAPAPALAPAPAPASAAQEPEQPEIPEAVLEEPREPEPPTPDGRTETGGPDGSTAPTPRAVASAGPAATRRTVPRCGFRSRGSGPPWSWETCTDRDAEQHDTDCWTDAVTRARREIAGRTVELRFSPACRAAWGRITARGTGDRVRVDTTDGRHQSRLVLVPGRYLYTLMIGVGRPSEARACVELPDGASACTGWGR